jgi:uncharacterized membrane protein
MTEPNQPRTAPPIDPDSPVDPAPPVATAPAGAPPAPPGAPPSTEWREPPWFPPRDRDRRERRAGLGAIVVGLIILAFGLYYFFDRTLGIPMPRIQWGSLWPLLLIVIGGWILVRSVSDRR